MWGYSFDLHGCTRGQHANQNSIFSAETERIMSDATISDKIVAVPSMASTATAPRCACDWNLLLTPMALNKGSELTQSPMKLRKDVVAPAISESAYIRTLARPLLSVAKVHSLTETSFSTPVSTCQNLLNDILAASESGEPVAPDEDLEFGVSSGEKANVVGPMASPAQSLKRRRISSKSAQGVSSDVELQGDLPDGLADGQEVSLSKDELVFLKTAGTAAKLRAKGFHMVRNAFTKEAYGKLKKQRVAEQNELPTPAERYALRLKSQQAFTRMVVSSKVNVAMRLLRELDEGTHERTILIWYIKYVQAESGKSEIDKSLAHNGEYKGKVVLLTWISKRFQLPVGNTKKTTVLSDVIEAILRDPALLDLMGDFAQCFQTKILPCFPRFVEWIHCAQVSLR